MPTNTNVTTIPGLFQFPPSLESELPGRTRRHDSEVMHLQLNQEGVPEYYKPSGAFARRLSTSMIASSSTTPALGTASRGQGMSLGVRHQSLTASGLRSNGPAIARPANPSALREGVAPLGQRGAYPLLSHQPSSFAHPLFLPNHLHPHPATLHAHAQSLSPPLLPAPPPVPPSSAPAFASAPRILAPPHGARPHAPHTFAYISADGDGDMDMNMASSPDLFGQRAAPHEERYPSAHLAFSSPSPPHLLPTHTEENVVKQEDSAQDEPMMWSHNAFYPPPSAVEPSYTEHLVDEPMDQPMYDLDVKAEPFTYVAGADGNVIDESWNNVLTYAEEPHPSSSAPLCIDTSAAVSHEYSTLPFGPGSDVFSDRPLDVHNSEMHQPSFYHQYQQHPQSPGPSLHTIPPPPSSQTRSYTLEGAITPISPIAPTNASFASASASNVALAHVPNRRESASHPRPTSASYSHTHRAFSPPPMGSLQPPSPHKQASHSNPHPHSYPQQVALEPSTAPASHAAGRHTPPGATVTTTSTYSTATSANTTPTTDLPATTSSSSQHTSIPTSAPVPAPAPASAQAQTQTQGVPVQKRPRGRPRKNPPGSAARVSSPPPAVDYPFPHFPDSHPASTSASLGPHPGNGSGRGGSAPRSAGGKGTDVKEDLEEAAILPPMSHPLPTLTVGTAGSTGPLPSSSSSSSSASGSSHALTHHHTSSGTSGGGSGSSKGHGNVPPGLTAGQGIFKLNVPNDAESELGADGSGAAGAGGAGSRSGAGAKGAEGEKKKPIMACLFCRERKIACGPPPPGAPRRCNVFIANALVAIWCASIPRNLAVDNTNVVLALPVSKHWHPVRLGRHHPLPAQQVHRQRLRPVPVRRARMQQGRQERTKGHLSSPSLPAPSPFQAPA
ncbi:hypothetical protein C8Q70DRAFT_205350 [Cubamyces menziesii]|nr:hypothetical protein C8Q70DRAFT_205350 [Cubamyces menziesii]